MGEKLTKGIRRVLECCEPGRKWFGPDDPPLWMVKRAQKAGLVTTDLKTPGAFALFILTEAGRRLLEESREPSPRSDP